MIFKPKEIMKSIEDKYLGFLDHKRNPSTSSKKLIVEAGEILKEIQEAGKNIANSKLRQQLESYAASCGLYIYEATNNYTNTCLDPLDDKIKQILKKYGEDGELDVEEFLLSSLKKIDNPKFKDTVISVLVDKLAYYWENLEELEDSELEDSESKQLENAIAWICQIAYLESLQNIIPWLDKETQEIWLNSFSE